MNDSIVIVENARVWCGSNPTGSSPEQIRALVDAGMDVARLNMSHGTHADHERAYRLVREAADATGHGVGIVADLQGPKIRLDTFADGPVMLEDGDRFTITTRDVAGDRTTCGTTYDGLPGDVSPGDPILVDDGKVRLEVVEVDGQDVVTKVTTGGQVSDHKGLNLPGVAVSVPEGTSIMRAAMEGGGARLLLRADAVPRAEPSGARRAGGLRLCHARRRRPSDSAGCHRAKPAAFGRRRAQPPSTR